MGTSNLYSGPKKTLLLPSDYNPEDIPAPEVNPKAEEPGNEEIGQENPDADKPENGEIGQILQPSVAWGSVRGSMRRAMNDCKIGNVKRAVSHYTKALGGHSNATKQAAKAQKTTAAIYSYFSGTPSAIRQRFEDAGIRFDGRPTKDIFNDICNLISPVPNDIDDSLINMATRETFADVATDLSIDLNQFESFNEELLQRLVGGLIKHFIYDKLIMQSEQTALKKCERTNDLRELEKSIKLYIDGIVDSVIQDVVKSNMNPADFNRAVETLFDVTYQQMEDMR